uniref:UPAR/Ly6 domain-containing protein n=1 Tax=Kryptolebias marmoratus TaxID=37003 RepID=A0A3Q2ZLG9_KRYMA
QSAWKIQRQIYKACAPSSLCPNTGNQTFSVNLGFSSAIASAQCCNSDDCNSETLPYPRPQPCNHRQCFVCDPSSSKCDFIVQCSGEETNCFTASVKTGSTTFPVQGCMTPNTCAATKSLGRLPFMEDVGSISNGPSCCKTNKCNSPENPPPGVTTAPTTTITAAPTTATTAPTTTPATTGNSKTF